jgi:monofunctional biosynthetic peptidoglycan transglycosylase
MAQKRNRRPFVGRFLRMLFTVISTFLLTSILLVLPLRWIDPPTSAFMLADNSGRDPVVFEWTGWEGLGGSAALAVVASEDQKFADHFGFDLESIEESVLEFRDGSSLRGASTITQQVAKNLYLWPGRNFVRKGLEAWFALLIEVCWSKKRILEVYLNIAELGPGLYGVPAASRIYFGKTPAMLSHADAALLAAVLPNPHRFDAGRPSEYVRERQRWILGQMSRLEREGWPATLER